MGNTATKEEAEDSVAANDPALDPTLEKSSGGDDKKSTKQQLQLTTTEKNINVSKRSDENENVTEISVEDEKADEGEQLQKEDQPVEPFDPDNYDPSKYGPILPNGEINWECPCLGGAAHGVCGTEFRAAFSCFHFSKEDPKGADCFPAFENMHNCFSKYPELYKSRGDEDDEEEEEEDAAQVQFDEDELKVIEEENQDNGNEKASPSTEPEQNEKHKTKRPESPARNEPRIPAAAAVL